MKKILLLSLTCSLHAIAMNSMAEWDLLKASERGNLDGVRNALAHCIKLAVNTKSNTGFTPLHVAAGNGHTAIAEFLITQGADVNTQTHGEDTPLHRAAERNQIVSAELLVKNGAAINIQDQHGDTPLHEAALKGFGGMEELLIESGADINLKNKGGLTAYDLAKSWGRMEMYDLIMAKRYSRLAKIAIPEPTASESSQSNNQNTSFPIKKKRKRFTRF